MAQFLPKRLPVLLVVALALLLPQRAQANKPDATEALKLKPIQADIDYDIPAGSEVAQCTLETYKLGSTSGWEVRDSNNKVLRRFLDTNADNKVDQWCYFKDGIEVYRDIDSNFNRKADQYRWLGTAGTRWAMDTNEDGRIDSWKSISPEEVSEEAIIAMRDRDADRFKLLLLTPAELRDLGLDDQQAKDLASKLANTASGYEQLLRTQKVVEKDAQWLNFGGTRPGIVPAGTDGAKKDLVVYENVAAVIESAGGHNQVIIGTLVKSGDVWRMIDLPKSLSDAQASNAASGYFFQASLAQNGAADMAMPGGLSAQVQDLISEMEQIDKDLASPANPEQLAQLNAKRADVLEKLAAETSDAEERVTWLRQLADTVSVAAQSGGYPEGVARLATLANNLAEQKADNNLIAYVQYRAMAAEYYRDMQQPDADFAKIQDKWLTDLERFVKDFPQSADTSEAMLQLAIAEEFAGDDDGAVDWYQQIVERFPDTTVAQKADGAKRRIESVGQPLVLSGKDRQGATIDVRAFSGKVVLVHYWATYFDQCMPGISVLKDMQSKYGKDKLVLIGVNVDSDRAQFDAYMKENPLSWPQLHAPGGLDSPLANAYGVLVLPTMILADQGGRVVNRNLDASQIDAELRRLLR